MSEHSGQEGGYEYGVSPEPMMPPEMESMAGMPEQEAEMLMSGEPGADSPGMAEESQMAQEMQEDEQLLARLEQEGLGGTHEPAPSPASYATEQSATYQQPAQPVEPAQPAAPSAAQQAQQADQQEVQNAQESAANERAEAQAVQAEESANQYAEQTYQQEDNAFDQTLTDS